MKYFYLLTTFLFSIVTTAQCLEQAVPLNQVVNDSQLIVEGEVISQTSRKNTEDSVIKTVHTVQLSRVFKGAPASNTIEIVTLGGTLNNEFNILTNAVELDNYAKGIFMLSATTNGDNMFTHGGQGLIRYSQSIYAASRASSRYNDIQNELYGVVEQFTGQPHSIVGNLNFRFTPPAVSGLRTQNIMSLSASRASAGSGSRLIILGSGFGANRGSGSVDFADADSGGAGRIEVLDTQYISWSDSQIEVVIRSGAGTGTVNVTTDGGSVFSSNTLEILFNHTNFTISSGGMDYGVEIRLADDNGSNGYTWNYAENLQSNNDAELTVTDSFEQWRCTTGRNFVLGADLAAGDAANTSNASGRDNVNVVKFDTGEIPSNSSTLGFLSIKGSICGSAPNFLAFATELDFVINSDTNYHFRDTASQSLDSNETDFRSVANHELGHAQLLGHVIDTDEVMHFSIGRNEMRRNISEFDQAGADFVNTNSVNDPASCSSGAMAYLSCDYVYENGSWLPFDPSGTTNPESNIIVRNGMASITDFLEVRNITTDSGATLLAPQNTYQVEILGDVVNNGSIDFSRMLMISSERNQSISGNPLETAILFAGSGSSLSLNTVVDVSSILNVRGTLNTNDNLRLLSSSTEEALVAPLTPMFASINGSVTTERYYAPNRAFRFISSSVNSGTTTIFDNWQNGGTFTAGIGTHITGGTTANGFDQSASNNPSLFTYNNTVTGSSGWMQKTSTNNPATDNLEAGTPYRLFVRGDRSPRLLTTNNTANETRIVTTGTLQVGPVTDNSISAIAGNFSFTGNPLHAAINMERVLTRAGSNVTSTYYIWDPQAADVGKYVAINTMSNTNDDPMNSAATKFAQVQQAFFVETAANGSASLTFEESDKSQQVNSAVNSIPSSAHIYGALHETQSFQTGGNRLDGFNLSFDGSYNDAIDLLDSRKLRNISESISTLESGNQLAIQQRQMPADSDVIGLMHENYRRTDYTYELEVMGLAGLDVFLRDNFTGISHPLAGDNRTNVAFTVDPSDPASVDPFRFSIEFTDSTLSIAGLETVEFNLYPNPTSGEFTIQLNDPTKTDLEIFSMTGQLVYRSVIGDRMNLLSPELKSGYYLVRLTQDGREVTKKLIVE